MLNFQYKGSDSIEVRKDERLQRRKIPSNNGCKNTFKKMVEILTVAENQRRAKGGPKPSLTVENMLMVALEYW